MEEIEPQSMKVTCRTPDCPVEGVTFTVDMYPNVDPPIWRAQCARCNQVVTDIVPA